MHPMLARLRPYVPLTVVALAMLVMWRVNGWRGVALVGSALVLWGLLRLTRFLRVMQLAARHPKAYIDSAVMFNAQLKPGQTLLQVVAQTQTLGQLESAPNAQPEVFSWTDPGQCSVRCEFAHGRLSQWTLLRPPDPDGANVSAGS